MGSRLASAKIDTSFLCGRNSKSAENHALTLTPSGLAISVEVTGAKERQPLLGFSINIQRLKSHRVCLSSRDHTCLFPEKYFRDASFMAAYHRKSAFHFSINGVIIPLALQRKKTKQEKQNILVLFCDELVNLM